jgi:hypothetical protein
MASNIEGVGIKRSREEDDLPSASDAKRPRAGEETPAKEPSLPAGMDPKCGCHLSAQRSTVKMADGSTRRHVEPYNYSFDCHSKRRWVGKTLLHVFTTEFDSHDKAYFEAAIAGGAIRVNGKQVAASYVIKELDRITHTLHRHEPDITDAPIDIIYEDERIVVVNKPPGMQVHPSGPFNYNTLLSLLISQCGFQWLAPLHRLDRLTSGIILLGASAGYKTRPPGAAVDPEKGKLATAPGPSQILKEIGDNSISKRYVARVRGKFPSDDSFISSFTPSALPHLPDVPAGDVENIDASAAHVKWTNDGSSGTPCCMWLLQ